MALSTREKVLNFVDENNGVMLREICYALGENSMTVNNHLNYLREKEYVYSVQEGGQNLFFWYSMKIRNADDIWRIADIGDRVITYY